MKKYILFSLFVILAGTSSAQTILDLFKWLPDTLLPEIDQPSRDYMVGVQTNDESIDFDNLRDMPFAFDLVDPKFPYLKVVSNISESSIEMCSWNMSGNAKMVAFYNQICSPNCVVNKFYFLRFNGSDYEPLFYQDIMPEDFEKEFFKGDMSLSLSEMKSLGFKISLLFQLPSKGKNITVKYGNEESNDIYEKWLKGNRMELVWKSGKFEKGKVYWE